MKIGYYAFFTAVIGLGILLLATLVPVPGNYEVKIVQSGSMEPAIQTGSVVIVRPTDDYAVDDVITYGPDTADQVPTTHRIIDMQTDGGETTYTTKGDANDSPDPRAVTEREIVGKVLLSIPYLGFVLDFARQPMGFALLVGLPAAIVIIDELVVIYQEVKGKRREEDPTPTSPDEESGPAPTSSDDSGTVDKDGTGEGAGPVESEKNKEK